MINFHNNKKDFITVRSSAIMQRLYLPRSSLHTFTPLQLSNHAFHPFKRQQNLVGWGMQQKRYQSQHLLGLPFRVKRHQADENAIKYHQFLEASHQSTENSALMIGQENVVVEGFVPFHSVDIKGLRSHYVADYGIDRTEHYWQTVYRDDKFHQELKVHTVTDWFRCKGTLDSINYPLGTLPTQIYAGFSYPRKLIEQVLPTPNIISIQAITKDMLDFEGRKKVIHPHEMNVSFALEKLSSRVYDLEKSRARELIRDLYHADHVRIYSLDVDLLAADIKLFSYHLPAYIYKTEIFDLASYKIINAYNGEVCGNKIYSLLKSSLFGAGIGAGIAWGVAAFTNPYLLIPQLLFRISIGSVLLGVLSAAAVKKVNTNNGFSFKTENSKDSQANARYKASDHDLKQRKLAAEMNGKASFVIKNNIQIPMDKCKLLGLDPETELTVETVSKAYKMKIREWHPDLFREKNSKAMADKMAQQINAAKDELINLLRNNQP